MTSARVKAEIYKAYVANKQKPLNFSEKALKSIINTLRTAFVDQQSTSMMINGSNHEALSLILQAQQILFHESRKEWVLEGVEQRSLIGRISGALNDSDAAAFLSLADQFCLRMNQDRNMNAMLEDLGVFFNRCKEDGTPALIVIEDFHLFAHQKRQTLIYTLLDLLHRADYLFAVRLLYFCAVFELSDHRTCVSFEFRSSVFPNVSTLSPNLKSVLSRACILNFSPCHSPLLRRFVLKCTGCSQSSRKIPPRTQPKVRHLFTILSFTAVTFRIVFLFYPLCLIISMLDSGSRIMTEKEALLQTYNASVESIFGAFHLVPIATVQHKWAHTDSMKQEELLNEEQKVLTVAHPDQDPTQQQTLKTEDTAMEVALAPSEADDNNTNNDESNSKRRKGTTGEVLELKDDSDNDVDGDAKENHRHKNSTEDNKDRNAASVVATNYNFFSLQPRPLSSSTSSLDPMISTNHNRTDSVNSSSAAGQVKPNSQPMPAPIQSSGAKPSGASNLANKLVAAAVSARAEALSGSSGSGSAGGARAASVGSGATGSGPSAPLAHKDIALHLSFGRRRRYAT